MPLLTSILFLLVAARLLGQLMLRLGQAEVVGEIAAGIILGPALLGYVQPTEALAGISELSVFFIVIAAGLEMEFGDVVKAFRGRGLLIAVLGFVIPFLSGILLGTVFGFDGMRTIFVGLCISITALPVAVRILESFQILNTTIARFSIATAILNDIAALLLLGVILDSSVTTQAQTSLWQILVQLSAKASHLLIFAVVVFIASRLIQWGGRRTLYIERGLEKMINWLGHEALFGIAIVFVLVFASISEGLGSHFVIGAFFAALLLSPDAFGTSLFADLESTLHSVTSGFLAPVFFAFLGLHFTQDTFKHPVFVIALLLVSVASKIGAGVLGGKLAKLSKTDALGIGIMLNGRGTMELVVANIALQRNFINEDLFSSLVLVAVVTTMLTPVLFRKYTLPHLTPARATNES